MKKKETPLERYFRRKDKEIEKPLAKHRALMSAKEKELSEELEAMEGKCNPCIDDCGFFEGRCKLCGVSFG